MHCCRNTLTFCTVTVFKDTLEVRSVVAEEEEEEGMEEEERGGLGAD